MVKGFKDSKGKFRPTEKKNGLISDQVLNKKDTSRIDKLKKTINERERLIQLERRNEEKFVKEATKHFDGWNWKAIRKQVDEQDEESIRDILGDEDPDKVEGVNPNKKFKAILLDDMLTLTQRAFESGLSETNPRENELKFEIIEDVLRGTVDEKLPDGFFIERNVDGDFLLIEAV